MEKIWKPTLCMIQRFSCCQVSKIKRPLRGRRSLLHSSNAILSWSGCLIPAAERPLQYQLGHLTVGSLCPARWRGKEIRCCLPKWEFSSRCWAGFRYPAILASTRPPPLSILTSVVSASLCACCCCGFFLGVRQFLQKPQETQPHPFIFHCPELNFFLNH